MTEQEFDLADILSISTGRLLSHEGIGGVYKILNFMTDDNLFTHQLPRAAKETAPELLHQLPWLAEITFREGMTNIPGWLAHIEDVYGKRHTLTSGVSDHVVKDPLTELAEIRGDHGVIVVEI
jgi:hypothetical protein